MAKSVAAKQRRAAARREQRRLNIEAVAARVEPICVECGSRAEELVGWTDLYRPRPDRPDLMVKKFWRCRCGAYVGCHKDTIIPLGHPAGPETQRARMAAHAAFDPMWLRKAEIAGIPKQVARAQGYVWLARALQIDPTVCHIGMMSRETAIRVVDLCQPPKAEAAA